MNIFRPQSEQCNNNSIEFHFMVLRFMCELLCYFNFECFLPQTCLCFDDRQFFLLFLFFFIFIRLHAQKRQQTIVLFNLSISCEDDKVTQIQMHDVRVHANST